MIQEYLQDYSVGSTLCIMKSLRFEDEKLVVKEQPAQQKAYRIEELKQ